MINEPHTRTTDILLHPSLVEAIRDAILFGNVREVEAVLNLASLDPDFPQVLYHSMEALKYFREFYGKDGLLEPRSAEQMQKKMLMENAWGAEILQLISQADRTNSITTPADKRSA
jgi:hypothetical protein